jgi:hypothetical protein
MPGYRKVDHSGYGIHCMRDPRLLVVHPDTRLIIHKLLLLIVLFESAEESDNI